jgi:hypothetical protein
MCGPNSFVLGEIHLRRVLKSYADYYNCVRMHRSLNKDSPVSRPVQRTGVISSRAILGGLHHRYAAFELSVHTPGEIWYRTVALYTQTLKYEKACRFASYGFTRNRSIQNPQLIH